MAETADQIENHIGKTRDELGANLHELEHKIQEMADWRHHFRNHPIALVGAAFGGGVLLAALIGGRRRNRIPNARSVADGRGSKTSDGGTLQNIKEAVLGVATERAVDFADEFFQVLRLSFVRRQHAKTAVGN